MANATKVGGRLLAGLKMLATKHASIGDVRGIGLMTAIDFVKSRETREPDSALREAVVMAAFHKGLLLLGCGPSAIRFCPPLVIDEGQADTCVRILDEVLGEARAK
jgi:4-aminobutyrate aminotransferase